MRKLLLLMLFIGLIACSENKVEGKFVEIKNNIARFDISNNTDKSIKKITYELSFLNNSDEIILIDTLSNQTSNIMIPFLKPKETTFVVNTIPQGCIKANIKILEVTYNP